MYANTGHLHFWQYYVPEGRKYEIVFLRDFFFISILNCGICFLSVTLKKSGCISSSFSQSRAIG